MCRSKEQGGLGLGKISLRNHALLGKWLWRFPKERSELWHEVIVSINGTHPNRWDANMVVRWSHKCPWKAIAQNFHLFIHHTLLMVGNGERVRFWEDLWLGDQPLCAQYPDLYRVIPLNNLTILVVLGSSPLSTLNLNFPCNLTDTEIEHFQRLLLSLGYVHLSPFTVDSRGWSLSSTCVFTVKSFFLALFMPPTPLLFHPAKFIWSSKAPSKVRPLLGW